MLRYMSGALFALLVVTPAAARPLSAPQCFQVPGITDCIDGRLATFWNSNGGLPVFGYPITPQHDEVNADTQKTYPTQWFERARFEQHTENVAPYDVLLGRLGAELLQMQGRDWHSEPNNGNPLGGACQHFDLTNRDVCGPFLTYWLGHRLNDPKLDAYNQSLQLFGFPLTGVKTEQNRAGDMVLTQWFERARFEWHPDKTEQFKVLLGLLGSELLGSPSTTHPPTPAPPSSLTFLAVADTFVSKDFPDTNFGKDGLLVIDASPYRETYIKFELSGLSRPVASAKLRVYVTADPDYNGGSPSGGSVARMSNTSWDETKVTYNTRPAIDGPVLATKGPVSPGEWYEFDVTAAVTDNGPLSLGLMSQDPNGVYIQSREVSGLGPQLSVTLK